AALRIREAKPIPSELLPQRLVLGLQILNHLRLLSGDPSDHQVQEELNRERHRGCTLARLQGAGMGCAAAIHVRSTARFRNEFASAEFWHNTRYARTD